MSLGMPHNGAPKLIEEMSELTKVLARIIAGSKTGLVDGKPIEIALREELADVVASLKFFCTKHGVRANELRDRVQMKFDRYTEWDKELEAPRHTLDCDMVKHPNCTRCNCGSSVDSETASKS